MKQINNKSLNSPTLRIKPVFLGISIVLGLVSVAQGAVTNINGAAVINQSNGPTIVHIKGPSAGGVSHNIYSQFDVDQKGLILNNSQTNTSTQLGGQINGNLNLSGGTANVILNEVNSNKASTLGGIIEVAGDKAQVIVANASGITCNNCGFINTERVTLTTGKTLVAGGQVIGYNVEKGQIVIKNRLVSDSPTDIIARSVAIGGDIRAKEINVVSGNNFVDAAGNYITNVTGVGYGYSVGIDVSSVGGMYADKITLVSTENGSGVNNAGIISAGTGGLTMSSVGNLFNGNKIQSAGAINSESYAFKNQSSMTAIDDVNITSKNSNFDNVNGQIASSGGSINLSSAGTLNNYGGVINAQKDINIKSDLLVNTNGSIKTTKGDINLRATTGIQNYHTLRNNVNIPDNRGIVSGNDLVINAGYVYNNNSNITGRDVTINARNLIDNSNNSTIVAKRKVNLDATSINNKSSLIKSTNGKMDIAAGYQIVNDRYASINSGKGLTIKSNTLTNSGSIISGAGKSVFDIVYLTNAYGYIKGYNLDFNNQTFSNESGLIQAENDLNIETYNLLNRSSISFKNYSSNFGLAGTTGGLKADNGSVAIKANSLDNYYGEISANISERGNTKGDVSINLRNNLDNRYGKITGMNTVKINADKLNNTYSGLIDAGKDAIIDVFTRIDNDRGRISSLGTTKITSPIIYNGYSGLILGMTIILDGRVYN
ncbi:MAG TPA: hypothetical protein DD649_08840 [Providencia sp.]|uniref:two-partner secretion domain-containing protein n=1 Tax=Providencia sp. TaxID=589 RepID=UPI000E8CFB84|nr:filamentous hemagglutinin N-terminal domain-containing protein [Providencia sp.]MBP6080424.1 filamentous hemagglutinin N-terminal domain-containing protein [Providencia sp.]HBO22976.1 hypothetical protein [Providencia sp.]